MAIFTMLAARMRRAWTRWMLLVLKMPSSASCMLDSVVITAAGTLHKRLGNALRGPPDSPRVLPCEEWRRRRVHSLHSTSESGEEKCTRPAL
jgi:hypothetical protein